MWLDDTASGGTRLAPRPAAPHIVIIGRMGSGKSTVGALVAAKLGRRLIDNDDELRAATGVTARRVEEEFGTAELHRLERHVFESALRSTEPSVITAAASVVDTIDATILGPHFVVDLQCSVPVGARRSKSGDHRPSIISTNEAQAQRDQRSRRLADLVIDVDDLDAQAAADRVVLVDLTALAHRLP